MTNSIPPINPLRNDLIILLLFEEALSGNSLDSGATPFDFISKRLENPCRSPLYPSFFQNQMHQHYQSTQTSDPHFSASSVKSHSSFFHYWNEDTFQLYTRTFKLRCPTIADRLDFVTSVLEVSWLLHFITAHTPVFNLRLKVTRQFRNSLIYLFVCYWQQSLHR